MRQDQNKKQTKKQKNNQNTLTMETSSSDNERMLHNMVPEGMSDYVEI